MLRNARRFNLVHRLGDAFIQAGGKFRITCSAYAGALLESVSIAAAINVIEACLNPR